jgi:hypothetical protein
VALGLGRASHCTVGIAAMKWSAPSATQFATQFATQLATLALVGLLAGCSSIGGFTGAVAGLATGTATTNPAIGVGVGIAVKTATDAAFRKVFRDMQADEQDRIAAIAGGMRIGEAQTWDIHHRMPFTDERGELRVVGAIDNALATCKEVMFSVAGGSKKEPTSQWFVTQTCRQSDGQWRWAAAEPAVARWGALQ